MRALITTVLVLALCQVGCKEDPKAECGNNRLDKDEVCDGTALDSNTCQSFGFFGGTLMCNATCTDFVFNNCTGGCGNNRAEGTETGLTEEEPCDGSDVRGQNCNVEGYELGTVTCLDDCSGFDTSDCYNPSCGDDVIEGHEECEPGLELGTTCVGRGYNEGDLDCFGSGAGDDACMYDESACILWECGNGIVEGLEQCDGTNYNDETCVTLGYDEGDIACYGAEDETPCRYNFDGCVEWVCGDGSVNGDEDCEDGVAITESCTDEGFAGGDPLGCIAEGESDECTYDYSNCTGGCGNGVVETTADGASFDETCDGDDLGGQDCTSLGFVGGDLYCLPTCDGFETSGCISA